MEGFLTRRWELILRWYGETSAWPEEQLSPRAGSMTPSQPVITQYGWGFYTLRGGIDPGRCVFVPGLLDM